MNSKCAPDDVIKIKMSLMTSRTIFVEVHLAMKGPPEMNESFMVKSTLRSRPSSSVVCVNWPDKSMLHIFIPSSTKHERKNENEKCKHCMDTKHFYILIAKPTQPNF